MTEADLGAYVVAFLDQVASKRPRVVSEQADLSAADLGSLSHGYDSNARARCTAFDHAFAQAQAQAQAQNTQAQASLRRLGWHAGRRLPSHCQPLEPQMAADSEFKLVLPAPARGAAAGLDPEVGSPTPVL
eukprot:261756-Rhodomonas_salina.2